MCIAIALTPGTEMTEELFNRCWRNNSHGFGMAYIGKTGHVIMSKAYMTLESAWKGYCRVRDDEVSNKMNMIVHFRAATVGDKGATNCHPFAVKDGAMVHNGTFYRDKSDRSDSATVACVLHQLLGYDEINKNFAAVEEAFGYNRVLFLHKHGQLTIINEKFDAGTGRVGQWNDGIWYSNGGWAGDYGANRGNGKKTI